MSDFDLLKKLFKEWFFRVGQQIRVFGKGVKI